MVKSGIFKPTKTSELLIKGVCNDIKLGGINLLDLGCGCGIVGSCIASRMNISKVYASDLSIEAIENAKLNFAKFSFEYEARSGSLFEPWKEYKFHNIVCDVSGVAKQMAEISGWFGEHAPCASGDDGTQLGIEIIEAANDYLVPGGSFYIAVLGLSDHKKLTERIASRFKSVKTVAEEEYFLTQEIVKENSELIDFLRSRGYIDVEERYGMLIWKTTVIKARN